MGRAQILGETAHETPLGLYRDGKKSGYISGFVLAIVAAIFVSMPIIVLPLGISAIALSARARSQRRPGEKGRGYANSGLIIGIVSLVVFALLVLNRFAT